MKVRAKEPVFYGAKGRARRYETGEAFEADDKTGAQLLASGAAEAFEEPKPAKEEAEPPPAAKRGGKRTGEK